MDIFLLNLCIKNKFRKDIDEAKDISPLRPKSKFYFHTFLKKKNQVLEFPCCNTCKDLSIEACLIVNGWPYS